MTDYHLPALMPPRANQPQNAPKDKMNDYALCQKYAAYIAQLRGVLQETTGDLPSGVSAADVEHRIFLIQGTLNEVERQHAEARWRIELRNNQRLLDNYERQMKAEEEAEKRRQDAEKERVAQVEEMRTLQVAYYKDRNDRTDVKAKNCRAYNEELQALTVMKAESREARRIRNFANLEAERRRKQKELHDREEEKQEYARQVRKRQATLDAEKQANHARLAEIHLHEMEAKLCALRESKRSKWSQKKDASRSKSVVVWKKGEAILETQLKDHDCLVDELERRQRDQAMRYAEEKAEQQAYIEQRRMLRAARQERQEENLRKLIDERLTRGTEIVKAAEEKKERADHVKEQQAARYLEARKLLDEDIMHHRLRAQKIQECRTNESLAQNYKRWNQRAARIMADLQKSIAEENSDEELRRAAADGRNRSPMYEDSHTSLNSHQPPSSLSRAFLTDSLPSPEEFAV
ncbi:hypothetical protein JKF63_03223 [Porcisia hertigi]|uniref:Uncharacterized protein n=1 Tax=Porcisia hertigi TaxID=2761500 RepID=A0A836LAP3_9TRYP|nr:hypothetical protein JKF63_03223 [Porcisia hertigi]